MRTSCRKQLKRGTTLAEVLMATAILAISIAGIIASVFSGFVIMGQVRENQRATQIILEKLETLRLYSWTQVNSNGFIPKTFSEQYDPQAAQGSKGITYQGHIYIAPFPYTTSYQHNMRLVLVTLHWNSERNIHRSRRFVTYIAKDGIQNYVY
jgi:type II secretory pathway pseudopilin PulG